MSSVVLELGPAATPVTLLAAGGREVDTGAETLRLVEAVCALGERVRLEVVEHEEPGPWPQLTIGAGLVYRGMPLGYELTALVYAIVEAGRLASTLGDDALERLGTLDPARGAPGLRHTDLTALPAGRAAGDTLRPRVRRGDGARDRGLGVPHGGRPPRRPRRPRRRRRRPTGLGRVCPGARVRRAPRGGGSRVRVAVGRPVEPAYTDRGGSTRSREPAARHVRRPRPRRAAGRRGGVRRPHAPRRRHRRHGRRPRRAARDPEGLRDHAVVHVLPRRARPPPGVLGRERSDARARSRLRRRARSVRAARPERVADRGGDALPRRRGARHQAPSPRPALPARRRAPRAGLRARRRA